MHFKSPIAFVLALIFLGKLLSIDAKLFNSLLHSNGLAVVNSLCVKKAASHDSLNGVFSLESEDQMVEMDYLCQTTFDHRLTEWSFEVVDDNFQTYSYQLPGITSIPGKKFYPPPRI